MLKSGVVMDESNLPSQVRCEVNVRVEVVVVIMMLV